VAAKRRRAPGRHHRGPGEPPGSGGREHAVCNLAAATRRPKTPGEHPRVGALPLGNDGAAATVGAAPAPRRGPSRPRTDRTDRPQPARGPGSAKAAGRPNSHVSRTHPTVHASGTNTSERQHQGRGREAEMGPGRLPSSSLGQGSPGRSPLPRRGLTANGLRSRGHRVPRPIATTQRASFRFAQRSHGDSSWRRPGAGAAKGPEGQTPSSPEPTQPYTRAARTPPSTITEAVAPSENKPLAVLLRTTPPRPPSGPFLCEAEGRGPGRVPTFPHREGSLPDPRWFNRPAKGARGRGPGRSARIRSGSPPERPCPRPSAR